MNFIPCKVRQRDDVYGADLESHGQHYFLALRGGDGKLKSWLGRDVMLGLRPEKISHPGESHQAAHAVTRIDAIVDIIEPTGPDTLVVVELNGKEIVCRVHPKYAKAPGESIELGIDLTHCAVFDPSSEHRIV
jgi:multiple sugar transport system ATP-binding protein